MRRPCGGHANLHFRTALPPRFLSTLAMTLVFAARLFAANSATPPQLPGEVSFQQKLNVQLPLDLMFRAESGKIVRLGTFFNHGKPVILNFMYYRCPMLCPMVM